MLQIALNAVIGFCATAGTIGLAHLLIKIQRRPEKKFEKRSSHG